jgi:hypothetical protein
MLDADAPPVAGIIFAGNILRLLCEGRRCSALRQVRIRRPKREKPRPWQVRGSRAEALPRFWLIVMLQRNAACALRATPSNLKPIQCDISAKIRSERRRQSEIAERRLLAMSARRQRHFEPAF